MANESAIVRMWTGVVRTDDRDAYVEYVERTGMDAYRSTAGNLDAWLLTRDLGDGRTEITTVSRWESLEAITAFAGEDHERAVYYPEDDEYLLERDERVRHFAQHVGRRASLSGDESAELPEFASPPPEPMPLAAAWLSAADARGVSEPLSMTFATASAAGDVGARTVDVKRLDETGLVFGTSIESRKGAQLAENPRAALQVYWRESMQQLRFEGRVQRLTDAESDALFADRSPASRAATAVAHQSVPFGADGSPSALLDAAADLLERFGDEIPRPTTWVGIRLVPDRVEFWHGRRDRMHRRLEYSRTDDGWGTRLLQP